MWLTLLFLTLPLAPPQGDVPAKRAECREPASEAHFFPVGWLDEPGGRFNRDRFHRDWYSKHLAAMAEPSLSCDEPPGESYRFLWLRTWGKPVAVRVESTERGAVISAVELSGAGGYAPGKVSRRAERKLTDAEWGRLANGLRDFGFWTAPRHIRRFGTDGAEWILEGRKGVRYHVVRQWTPDQGAFRELCISLLRLVDWVPTGTGKGDRLY